MSGLNKSNKYNIGVIIYPFTDMVGESITKNFVKILEPLVKNLYLITGQFSYTSERVHVIKIKTTKDRNSLLMRPFKYISTQLDITHRLVKICKNVDIIIFFLGARSYTLPLLLAKLLRKKVIIVLTGMTKEQAISIYSGKSGRDKIGIFFASVSQISEKINFHLADRLGIAKESKSIIRSFGLEKYRTKIVSIGAYCLDTNFKIKKRLNERGNIIGYVGRLSEEKGVIELARAIPLILSKKNDIRFLIVGNGRLMENMKDVLSKAECLDKVDFVGWIPHEKTPDYLNEMKFHILSSHTEAFGGAAIEAMACGTISIANSVGGLPDVITDGESGFLLKDNQPQTIADKVLEIWDHPELDEIQRNAREFVEKTFSYEKAVERCKSVFTDLLEHEKSLYNVKGYVKNRRV